MHRVVFILRSPSFPARLVSVNGASTDGKVQRHNRKSVNLYDILYIAYDSHRNKGY